MTKRGYWISWGALALAGSAYLAVVLTTDTVGGKAVFLPGTTTAGHHQIELACASCHTPFGGVVNDACARCHAAELAAVDDSHPRSKFTDPRNAELATRLDATRCVTCHVEHQPEITDALGVTLPTDFCITCHAEVGTERPSHQGMAFATCASAGCHNYHDNTALYQDFLVAHASEPALLAHPRTKVRDFRPAAAHPAADAPPGRGGAAIEAEWAATAHARGGVSCTGCHGGPAGGDRAAAWIDRPDQRACATCHSDEVTGFVGGRHGMRRAIDLPPMSPSLARLPMRAAASARELTCGSCHAAHRFDTRRAAVTACLDCHADDHSRAYLGTPHHQAWTRETSGAAPAGTGVSCATCHLPRQMRREAGHDAVVVQHNQSANLRPNEKMTRTVCLDCHGLGFSLDALADPALIASNFAGRPRRSIASIEMATTLVRRSKR